MLRQSQGEGKMLKKAHKSKKRNQEQHISTEITLNNKAVIKPIDTKTS